MDSVPWILISVLLVATLLIGFLIFWVKSKKSPHPVNYYTFFVMGIAWLPLGIIMENYVLSAMGLVFLVVGLLNKDKWNKNRETWNNLSEKQKKILLTVLGLMALIVVGGLVFYLLYKWFF